jgi:FixJ family two-component response regulator
MGKRTIYMSEPLERLAEKTQGADRRNGGFSRRLGETVDRYEIIMGLTDLPDFDDTETQILSEVICGSVISRSKVAGMHLDIIDASIGTQEQRAKLLRKIEELSIAQRIKLIEKLGQ